MKKKRIYFILLLDIISISLSYLIALVVRFEGYVSPNYVGLYLRTVVVVTILKIAILYLFKLYKSLWEYASIDELIEVVFGVFAANICTVLYLMFSGNVLPRSVIVLITIFDIILIGMTRFFYRIFRRMKSRIIREVTYKNTLIIGAGDAGAMVLKELRVHDNLKSKPVAFIDDNPKKKGTVINGIMVAGNRFDIIKVCDTYAIDEIIIAMPSVKSTVIREILQECRKTNCKTKILPGMYELIDGSVNVSQIRDVQIEDLLGRDEVQLNVQELNNLILNKRIMVTGGGGSIGSELCRQIAKFNPNELVILDIYENNAYDIQNELLKRYPNLNLRVIIASVRDRLKMEEIIEKMRPNLIFHAAAHKHVPLMEDNPTAAVKNNVFGTLNMVRAADKYNIDKFIFISTDKAVNPTNVMGATKRVCEMLIQGYNSISKTDYVAVRFGNVLGSNGSVIPLFKKQIAEGGPVTVTDERVIRYFMTITEACQLVLQAGSMAYGGEIFILDMGSPVKIVDLARNLIRLSGLQPDLDIPIVFTGLRPGEKLFEEMLLDKEKMTETSNNKIYIEEPMEFEIKNIMSFILKLEKSLGQSDAKIKATLAEIVPTYKPFTPLTLVEDLDPLATGSLE